MVRLGDDVAVIKLEGRVIPAFFFARLKHVDRRHFGARSKPALDPRLRSATGLERGIPSLFAGSRVTASYRESNARGLIASLPDRQQFDLGAQAALEPGIEMHRIGAHFDLKAGLMRGLDAGETQPAVG